MLKRTTALLLASFLVPAALAAQQTTTSAQQSTKVQQTTTAGQSAAGHARGAARGQGAQAANAKAQARIDAMLSGAAKTGIPVSLLQSKIEEGHAKGVSMTRIEAAVQARYSALVHARDVLSKAGDGKPSADELSVTADALQAGASERSVEHVTRTSPPQRRVLATATLGTLVQLGIGSDQAQARVETALAHGMSELANLHAQAATALRLHGPGSGLSVGHGGGH